MYTVRDWLAFDGDDRSLDADVRRREFVRYLALLGGMAALDPERLASTLRGAVQLDRTLVEQLRSWTWRLAGQWSTLPPAVLRPNVDAHLHAVLELLAGPLPAGLRRDLMTVGAHAAVLAGLVARMDGDDDQARDHLHLADRLAASADEAGLEALALVWSADTLSGVQRGGEPLVAQRDLLAMLGRAEDLAGPSAAAAVRAQVMLRLAEEHVAAGDGVEARRYLDRADTAIDLRLYDNEDDLYGLGWQRDLLHRAFRGNVELLAGNAPAAVAVLADALERTPAEATSNQAALLSDLAAAHARVGDLDVAVSLLGSAWAIADRIGLADRRQRIRGIRHRDLARWSGEPAVSWLDEAINASLAP